MRLSLRRGVLTALALAWAAGAQADTAAAAPAAAPAPATRAEVKEQLKGTRQDLKDLKGRIKKGKQELRQHERQERSLVGQLTQLNRELENARREQRVHVKNLGLVEDRLRSVRSELDLLQAEEAADRDALVADLQRLYKARGRQGARMIFSAHTPAELAVRSRYLEELSGATHRRVRTLRDRVAQVEGYRREFSDREQELKRRQEDAEAARQRVERERLRRQALLRDVRSRKLRAAGTVHELEQSAGRLQGLMDALQKTALRLVRERREAEQRAAQEQRQGQGHTARATAGHGKTPHISAAGGRSSLHAGLLWPVAGRIVARYGKQVHPIFHVPVFNRGIEIAAAYGSGVRAVANGTVVHASEMEGFGQLVVLDHGGGMMSVYGYGSQLHVAEGQAVEQGDLLEDVGEAGTSGQPALYFEIRQGAKALDPMRYLRRR